MRHFTDLAWCEVTLISGETVEVWADGYQEVDRTYIFGVLADVDEEQPRDLLVTGTTPTNPERVIVAPSRFPQDTVAKDSWRRVDRALCRNDREARGGGAENNFARLRLLLPPC